MPTPGTQGESSAAAGDPNKAQRKIIHPPSPPCSRTVPWSKHLFSKSNIPQLDGDESFSSEEELHLQALTPTVAPLVQYAHSRLTPLAPIHQLQPTLPPTPRQPVSYKPAPSPTLHQPPLKQLQPTQILDNNSTNRATEQQEQEQEQQESEPYQQEPEPEQESETFTFNISSEYLFTNGTLDRDKASAFFHGVNEFFKPNQYEDEQEHLESEPEQKSELVPKIEITAAILKDLLEYINEVIADGYPNGADIANLNSVIL